MWPRGEGIPEGFKKSMIFLRRYKDKDESGDRRVGERRSEIRDRRSEIRDQRSEIRDRRSEIREISKK
jgi:hypothetical protein